MQNRPWQRHYDYNVPTDIRYPRIPVPELLQIPANSYPDKAALNYFGTEITFWELRRQVLRMANALGESGIKKGDRIGLHLPNCPQYPIAYYAALSIGAIVVNMNPLYTQDELKLIAETTGLKALVTFDMVLDTIRGLTRQVKIPKVIVTGVTDFINGMPLSSAKSLNLEEGWFHFSTLLDECKNTKRPGVSISPDDPAVIQFTGGTTGVPKGAVLTHSCIIAATVNCALWGNPTVPLTPPEKRNVLAVLPYFHVYGNIVVMNWAVWSCATQIQVPRFEIDELFATIANYDQITFFPTVPTLITALVSHPKAPEQNLGKKLGLLNSGAAPMPVELIEKVQDLGIFFSEGWGMSETTSVGMSNPILGLKKAGSIGIPIPGADIRLVDLQDGNEDVPKGEPGEIIIKSPFVMKGYWNNPEETAKELKDGWLHTGDIAIQDDDDYFFIVDRKKDMIIAGGFNIYPREVDEVLYQHPKVQDAVTAGIPHEYRGETVKAFIVPKEGVTLTEEEIVSFCKEKLTAYKVPKEVEFRKELPKSAVGKVLRKVLREEEIAKQKAKKNP
ncbi:MAG: long-chain fatty acid--CoA ligase [Syntrophales bacterium]|jgi:long-chain acyl-CoA synthetase|nr:long-chain fatty acid--CoA ligase [Syntrophales bacterium]MDY0044207.1 long-chain fatty acid--CoA ligase [Syntrophales bacterium]